MMKAAYVLRRKPGMSLEEFQRYWREVHGPLVRKWAPKIGMVRYIQVHAVPPPARRAADPVRGQMPEPYDGIAEWWIDPSKATGTPEERREAARILAEDEANFIDFSRSCITRGDEVHMIGPVTPID